MSKYFGWFSGIMSVFAIGGMGGVLITLVSLGICKIKRVSWFWRFFQIAFVAMYAFSILVSLIGCAVLIGGVWNLVSPFKGSSHIAPEELEIVIRNLKRDTSIIDLAPVCLLLTLLGSYFDMLVVNRISLLKELKRRFVFFIISKAFGVIFLLLAMVSLSILAGLDKEAWIDLDSGLFQLARSLRQFATITISIAIGFIGMNTVIMALFLIQDSLLVYVSWEEMKRTDKIQVPKVKAVLLLCLPQWLVFAFMFVIMGISSAMQPAYEQIFFISLGLKVIFLAVFLIRSFAMIGWAYWGYLNHPIHKNIVWRGNLSLNAVIILIEFGFLFCTAMAFDTKNIFLFAIYLTGLEFVLVIFQLIREVFVIISSLKDKKKEQYYHLLEQLLDHQEKNQVLEEEARQAQLILKKSKFEIKSDELKFTKKLGEGGSSSVVFLAQWNGMEVAAKMYKINRFTGEVDLDAFEQELSLLSSLNHPNLIHLYGCCLEMPRICIVMELCRKGSLEDMIVKGELKSLSIREKLSYMYSICLGVEYLHSRSILHRDLKPDNILLTENNEVKIMDLGISKDLELKATKMTQAIGTSYYIAPEILLTQRYNDRADIFSLAFVFYEIFYCKKAFKSFFGIELQVAKENLRPSFDSEIPIDIQKLIETCWLYDPDSRPSIREVRNEIRTILDQHSNDSVQSASLNDSVLD